MLLASLLLLVVAGLLARRAVAPAGRLSPRMAHIAGYAQLTAPAPVEAEPSPPVRERVLIAVGGRLLPRLGASRVERLQVALRSAGLYEVAVERFVGLQAAGALGGLLLTVWAVAGGGVTPGAGLALGLLALYAGLVAPLAVVSRRGRRRTAELDRGLPELVDLLVVAVEAGLALGAALDRAAAHLDGVLADELRLVLQEQGLGATSAEALDHLVERSDTPAMRSFVRTLVQGERLGTPIGQTMRAIAVEMRKRRRAAAEEQAQKAPVKMLFPLVFCIFPTLLVVLLGPASLQILDQLGHG